MFVLFKGQTTAVILWVFLNELMHSSRFCMRSSEAEQIEIIGWVQPNVKKETYHAKQ